MMHSPFGNYYSACSCLDHDDESMRFGFEHDLPSGTRVSGDLSSAWHYPPHSIRPERRQAIEDYEREMWPGVDDSF